jgi:hypothetical protein
MSRGIRGRGLGSIAAIVLAGLLIGTQASLAGIVPPTKVKGTVGKWSLMESWTKPSVTCFYDYRPLAVYKYKLTAVEVRPPKVKWPNRRADRTREHGKIGWRLKIMEWKPTKPHWRTVYNSGVQKARAYERRKAPLVQVGLDWPFEGDHLYAFQHRIFWYKKNGKVLGSVKTWSKFALNKDGEVDGVLRPATCRNRYESPYP